MSAFEDQIETPTGDLLSALSQRPLAPTTLSPVAWEETTLTRLQPFSTFFCFFVFFSFVLESEEDLTSEIDQSQV